MSDTMKLSKADYKFLERMFTAEIEGRVFQTKSVRMLDRLERCVQEVTVKLGRDRFGEIVVHGYALTDLGRLLYCEWASKQAGADA